MSFMQDFLVSDNSAVRVRVDRNDPSFPLAIVVDGHPSDWWLTREDAIVLIQLIAKALVEVPA